MIALCSTSIDWAATGTWVTGLVTAVIGLCALRTWKSQLKLQDRYQKVDALLEAFVLCVRTGHNWQWNEISNTTKDQSSVMSKSELLSNLEVDFTNTLKDGLLELGKLRNP